MPTREIVLEEVAWGGGGGTLRSMERMRFRFGIDWGLVVGKKGGL